MVSMRFIVTVRVRHQMDIYIRSQIWGSSPTCLNWTGSASSLFIQYIIFLNKLCERKLLVSYLNARGYAHNLNNSFSWILSEHLLPSLIYLGCYLLKKLHRSTGILIYLPFRSLLLHLRLLSACSLFQNFIGLFSEPCFSIIQTPPLLYQPCLFGACGLDCLQTSNTKVFNSICSYVILLVA